MNGIVFDIETKDAFTALKKDPEDLSMSVCGIYDYSDNYYHVYEENDLEDLWKRIQKTSCIIGYNSEYFDIPILNKYCPYDLSELPSIDIMKEIRSVTGRRIKLDKVAEGTLGRKKEGDGMDAIKWWQDGEIEKIKKYCQIDVEITKELLDFIKKNEYIIYIDDNISHKVRIKINWDKYENSLQNGVLF